MLSKNEMFTGSSFTVLISKFIFKNSILFAHINDISKFRPEVLENRFKILYMSESMLHVTNGIFASGSILIGESK